MIGCRGSSLCARTPPRLEGQRGAPLFSLYLLVLDLTENSAERVRDVLYA